MSLPNYLVFDFSDELDKFAKETEAIDPTGTRDLGQFMLGQIFELLEVQSDAESRLHNHVNDMVEMDDDNFYIDVAQPVYDLGIAALAKMIDMGLYVRDQLLYTYAEKQISTDSVCLERIGITMEKHLWTSGSTVSSTVIRASC